MTRPIRALLALAILAELVIQAVTAKLAWRADQRAEAEQRDRVRAEAARDEAETWAKRQTYAADHYLTMSLNAAQRLRLVKEQCGAF